MEFYYTPARTKVLVYEDEGLTGSTAIKVGEFVIVDSSYPVGKFAFYSNSQQSVVFSNFSLASLDGYAAVAGADQTISSGGSATLSGTAVLAVPGITCQWSAGGTTVATSCQTTVSPSATTTYTLTVTDAFGRASTDTVDVIVQ